MCNWCFLYLKLYIRFKPDNQSFEFVMHSLGRYCGFFFCSAPFLNGCHIPGVRLKAQNLTLKSQFPVACHTFNPSMLSQHHLYSEYDQFWLSGRKQYNESKRLKTRYSTCLKMLATAFLISFVSPSSRKLYRLKSFLHRKPSFLCLNMPTITLLHGRLAEQVTFLFNDPVLSLARCLCSAGILKLL